MTYAAPPQVTYAAPVAAPPSYVPPPQMMQPQVITAPPVYAQSAPQVTYAAPQAMQMMPAMQPQMSAFDQFDANHDGVITQAEFAAMGGMPMQQPVTYAAPAPQQMTYAAPQQMSYLPPQQIAQMPTQVMQAAPVYAAPQPAYQMQAQAPSMFDQFDRNHDGVITQAEFAAMGGMPMQQFAGGAPQMMQGGFR